MARLLPSRHGQEIRQRMQGWQEMEIAFFAVLGLVFGSFLNVVRVRIPAGESIVRPGSHCVRCGEPLRWWQNLPVLSWALLRGRCHGCGEGISPMYPLVELATAGLWAGCAAAARGPGMKAQTAQATAMAVFCWGMLLLAVLDWKHLWLPDQVTWPMIGLGLLWQGLRAGIVPEPPSLLRMELLHAANLHPSWGTAVLMAALAAMVGAGMVLAIRLAYWMVRRREGMGLGDAKLMAALGAWLGWTAMLDAFFVAVLAATLAALVWLAVLRWKKSDEAWGALPLPLGSFLALAAVAEAFHPAWLWTAWMGMVVR